MNDIISKIENKEEITLEELMKRNYNDIIIKNIIIKYNLDFTEKQIIKYISKNKSEDMINYNISTLAHILNNTKVYVTIINNLSKFIKIMTQLDVYFSIIYEKENICFIWLTKNIYDIDNMKVLKKDFVKTTKEKMKEKKSIAIKII